MKDETLLIHTGRDPEHHAGVVNLPVYRASTILYPSLAAYRKRHDDRYDGVTYGTRGTPTTVSASGRQQRSTSAWPARSSISQKAATFASGVLGPAGRR